VTIMRPVIVVMDENVLERLSEYTDEVINDIRANRPEFAATIDEMCERNNWTHEAIVGGTLIVKALLQ
jgi:hypothetical protein